MKCNMDSSCYSETWAFADLIKKVRKFEQNKTTNTPI